MGILFGGEASYGHAIIMGSAFAARLGDQVGHGGGWGGLIAGAVLGAAVVAALIAAAPVGILALGLGSLLAVGTTTGLASVGAKIGAMHVMGGVPCGPVLSGAVSSEDALRRGTHLNTQELCKAIEAYVSATNDEPKPFRWTKTADQIIASVSRFCARTLEQASTRRSADSGH